MVVESPRISKEDVLEMLDNPEVSIIDLRQEHDWQQSREKIRCSIREDPAAVSSWAENYSREKTTILYCA